MPVPNQPQVLTPQNGQLVDYTGGVTFTWTYDNADQTQDQTEFYFRRYNPYLGDWEYWNGSAWSTLGAVASVSSSNKYVTIPASAWYMAWENQNYFDKNAGQFESTIALWTGLTNCSATRDTGTVFQGVGSLKITVTANGSAIAGSHNGSNQFMRAAIGANELGNLRCWIKAGSAVSRTASIGLRWYNAANVFVSDTNGASVTISNDKWYLLEGINLAAPAYAAKVIIIVNIGGSPLAGETYFADGFFYPYIGYDYIGMQETWLYNVSTKNSSGQGPFSESRLITVVYPNVVTVIAPTGSPTVSRPLVTWANQSYSGMLQDAYRVKIFDSATYGGGGFDPSTSTPTWDSGIVVSQDTQTRVGVNLVNGTTYRAYVQIRAGGATAGLWTAWAYSGFTESLTVPATPGLTVTPNPTTGNFTLACTNASSVKYVIDRSIDGGTTWEEVRGATRASPTAAGTSINVTDDEAPLRIPVTYRVYAATGTAPDLTYSAAYQPAAQTCNATKWWLRDPLTPASRVAVVQAAADTNILSVGGSQFLPEGRTKPVVLFGRAPLGAEVRFELWALSEANHDAIMALLTARKTLCVQNVHGDRWYVRLTSNITRSQVHAAATASETYPVRYSYTLSFTALEVEAP